MVIGFPAVPFVCDSSALILALPKSDIPPEGIDILTFYSEITVTQKNSFVTDSVSSNFVG